MALVHQLSKISLRHCSLPSQFEIWYPYEVKAKWELISNHQGEFAQRVPAGKADYIITADVKQNPKPELTVHVDNDERKDFVLHMKGSNKQ